MVADAQEAQEKAARQRDGWGSESESESESEEEEEEEEEQARDVLGSMSEFINFGPVRSPARSSA